MSNTFTSRGQHLYKLADPYRQIAYLPIDAATMADNLGISYRSALRVCTGQRKLKTGELLALQVIHFGLIPDKSFLKSGFYFRDGKLQTTKLANYELTTGQLFEYSLLKSQVIILQSELALANEKLKALSEPEKPSNVVNFADFRR